MVLKIMKLFPGIFYCTFPEPKYINNLCKNNITIHFIMLLFRKCIETGELKFHNHEEYCTGRCVSRQVKKAPDGSTTSSSMLIPSPPLRTVPVSLIKSSGNPRTISLLDTLSKNNVMFVQNVDRIKPQTQFVPEHAYCHIPIPPEKGEQLEKYDSDEEVIDRKPDVETLQKMLMVRSHFKPQGSSIDEDGKCDEKHSCK